MKNISIQWKIFSYLLFFSFVLLLLLWLFQVVFLDKFYQSIKISEMKSTAHSIEKSINEDDIGQILKTLSKNKDLSIEILSDDGASIYAYKIGRDSSLENMSVFDKINLLVKARESGGEFFSPMPAEKVFPLPGDGKNSPHKKKSLFMVMAKTIPTGDGKTMGLLISSGISPIDATVSTLRTQLYYMTIFILLFSIILAMLMARRVSRPIEKLNASTKLLASGDYQVSFDGKGYREIDELSNTLNYTASQLSKVENLRQELIANISHDLRTPLTLISGYAEIMRDIPGENTSENAQVIIDESQRLTSLVNDMLQLSKLQAENEIFRMESYNLTESIRETTYRLNEFLKNQGYHIEFQPEEEVLLTADKNKISQVIYNLLINAVNYSGPDKTILVTQKRFGDQVTISVTDSGRGISPELLLHIWDRYYKSDSSHKRPVTGTGLGLSIVKKLVENHQGTCGVHSQENQGSTFWFTLPNCRSL